MQAAATVACAPLLAALARPYAGAKARRARSGYVTLLYPPLLALGFDEFHELGLFTPLVLALVLSRGSSLLALVCDLRESLAIGLREDAALTLVVFGVVLVAIALRRATRGRGLLDGFAAHRARLRSRAARSHSLPLAALVLYYGVDRAAPGRMGAESLLLLSVCGRAARARRRAAERIRCEFARAIFTFGRLTYVLEALVPLAFLPLRSLVVAAGAARRRDRSARELRIRLADGRSLRRAMDPVAARRDRDGRRVARAAQDERAARGWTARRPACSASSS